MTVRPSHLIEYAVFVLLTGFLRMLPLPLVRACGRWMGDVAYSVLTSRRKVTSSNLEHAYPEMEPQEIRAISRQSFRSVGEASLELGWLARLTPSVLRRQMVLSNPDMLTDTIAKGRGAVVVVSHYAGWELVLQGLQQYAPGNVSVVYKPLSNPLVDRIVLRWRSRLGLKWIPLEHAVDDTMEAVRSRGEVVILAGDQSVGPESIWVKFFGREVPTAKGPAALALKTGAPLFLSAIQRQKDGTCAGPLVRLRSDDLVGYNEENLLKLTQRLTDLTEEYIRKEPGQWMWTHKRWKHWNPQEDRTSEP